MEIKKAIFVKSAANLQGIPVTTIPEVAFIGRSNVGKSTLINMLTGIKGLAKASNKPGKTQLMNFFIVDDSWHLVDLPGYGYAKAGTMDRVSWMNMMQKYFMQRKNLLRVFVLIDINVPVQKLDMEFVQQLYYDDIPFDIIITKLDKATQKDLHKNIASLRQELKLRFKIIPNIFHSSSTKKLGKQEILDYIEDLMKEKC